jgi:hypothetical protein
VGWGEHTGTLPSHTGNLSSKEVQCYSKGLSHCTTQVALSDHRSLRCPKGYLKLKLGMMTAQLLAAHWGEGPPWGPH